MSIAYEVDGSDLVAPESVMLRSETGGYSARAMGAEFTTCTMIVEDSGGTLDFSSFATVRIRETTATAGDRVFWAGFVAEQRISGVGNDIVYPVGAGRVWELDIEECNVFVQRRLLRPDDGAKRPAESIDTRIDWLLTTVGFTGGLIVDHGLVESSSLTMDAFDYTGQTGKDVLDGCAVRSGFTPHIRYREASNDYQLIFLDFLRSGQDLSTLRISNVAADVDSSVTFAPNARATLHRSPDKRRSGTGVTYPNGFSYEQDAGTQALIGDVDRLSPAGDVQAKATADALATRQNEQEAYDQERIDNLTIRVPAASVNIVKQGQRIDGAKFRHFTSQVYDWTDYVPCRVLSRNVRRPDNLTQGFYDLDLELVPLLGGTATSAMLAGPQDDAPPAIYIGSGVMQIGWWNDGDHPFPGASPEPLTGLVAYNGSVGARTGLTLTGTGLLTAVRLAFSVSLVVSGSHTFTGQILLNTSVIATGSQVTSGGLRSQQWTVGGTSGIGTEITASNVAVYAGDVITARVITSAGTPPDVIPVGVGESTFRLSVLGSLVA